MPVKTIRQALQEALAHEMRRDPTVVVIGEDVSGGAGTEGGRDAAGGVLGVTKGLIKEFGESTVQSLMEQIVHLFTSNIRSNDLAFRYGMTTIAIILGETHEKEALMAVEKLRKLLADVKLPGKDQRVNFSAGLAEAVVRQQYDAVDIVTEVINRAEQALESAMAQGLGKVVCQAPNLTAAAVA